MYYRSRLQAPDCCNLCAWDVQRTSNRFVVACPMAQPVIIIDYAVSRKLNQDIHTGCFIVFFLHFRRNFLTAARVFLNDSAAQL